MASSERSEGPYPEEQPLVAQLAAAHHQPKQIFLPPVPAPDFNANR